MMTGEPNSKTVHGQYQPFLAVKPECSQPHSENITEQLSIEVGVDLTCIISASVQSVHVLNPPHTQQSYCILINLISWKT